MGKERTAGLTPRQREWLGHLRRAAREGKTVRSYARRHGLSEHALYQATKELRRKGVLPRRASRPAGAGGRRTRPGRFVEVKAIGPAAPAGATGSWCARLPNGVVLEGHGELGGLLEALGRL